jgi:CxxC motif-containing protein (DUF1111 family)/cytochrome c553
MHSIRSIRSIRSCRSRLFALGSSDLGGARLLLVSALVVAGCAGGASRVTGSATGNAGVTGTTTGNPSTGNPSTGNPSTGNPTTGSNPDTGTAGGTVITGVAGSDGSTGTGGTGIVSTGSAGVGVLPTGPCVATGSTTAPTLPTSFNVMCSACHSAFGPSANKAVPNLFDYTAGATGTVDAFKSQVRAPQGAIPGSTVMPAFTTAQISDDDVAKVYSYFKAGATPGAATCPGADGKTTANLGCSGTAVSYSPLFVPQASSVMPIAYTDPTSKHLIFRGAGRVRFRHEMEDTFAVYHDHYFNNRTFSYILDDSIAAGGTTIKITFRPVGDHYYSKQIAALFPGVMQEGGSDLNIRAWKLYGGIEGNAFAANAGGASNNVLPTSCPDPSAPSCSTHEYSFTLNRNDRAGRAIQVGDQLQVEFGFFLARYPGSDGGHVENVVNPDGSLPNNCHMNAAPFTNACYTQANYYSDSFRYVVGKGTVSPSNEDCTMAIPVAMENAFPKPYDCSATGPILKAIAAGTLPDRMGPVEAGWSAGSMTQPYLRQRHDLYYSQMGPAIQAENAQNFVQGRRLFHTNYTTGNHIEVNNEIPAAEVAVHANLAGPQYNQLDCEGCHSHNNRGVFPGAATDFDSIVVKIAGTGKDANGGPTADPNYGKQLQNHAVSGTAEGSAQFTLDTSTTAKFTDGTTVTLTKPTTVFKNMSAGAPANYSVRLARPLIGMGLLEAIPEADILAHADPTDCNGDGIKGVPNLVFDPEDGTTKLGRFGWKASKASVRMQAAEALNLDIGVTSSVYPKHDCGSAQASCLAADKATPELSDADLSQIVTYMRTLGVPARRDLNSPAVVRGEGLFASLGCVNCHQPNQHTGTATPFLELQNQVIHPYSDLLLHDMGGGLADNNSQGEYQATSTTWRTPPLWGIGLCDEVSAGFQMDQTMNPAPNNGPCHYLHDGRAGSLLEAVLWHGGEAAAVQQRVLALPSADRDALVAFLKSL